MKKILLTVILSIFLFSLKNVNACEEEISNVKILSIQFVGDESYTGCHRPGQMQVQIQKQDGTTQYLLTNSNIANYELVCASAMLAFKNKYIVGVCVRTIPDNCGRKSIAAIGLTQTTW